MRIFIWWLWTVAWLAAGSCTQHDLRYEGPLTVSAVIVAAEGGTLTLPDGARVVIPPGALSRDAEVTFSRITCRGIFRAREFVSCAYSVTAGDGVTIADRYNLTIPSRDPARTPACMFSLTDDGWRCQAAATTAPGLGATTASKFSTFALHVNLPSTRVTNMVTDLESVTCGGDPFGEWKLMHYSGSDCNFTASCRERNPAFDVCEPFDYYEGNVISGRETLIITPADGNGPEAAWLEEHHYHEGYELQLMTESCLAQAGYVCPVLTPWCTSVNGLCTCRLPIEGAWGGTQALFQVDGGYSTMESGRPLPFCVTDDRLLRFDTDPVDPAVWVYQRK